MLLFFYLFTFAIKQKFVTADVTTPLVIVNNQHGIQQWEQNFDKMLVFERVHSKEVDREISQRQSCGYAG